jgi:SnoaL-like domain
MKPSESDIQYCLDRLAIEDVLNRYFQGIDRHDFGQVRSCFSEDIKAIHHNSPVIEGLDNLIPELEKRAHANGMRVMTHFMGNINVTMIGADTALAETSALSFHVHEKESGNEIDMRSLRYLDKLKRVEGKWLICERRHTLDWNCWRSAAYAVAFTERVSQHPVFT